MKFQFLPLGIAATLLSLPNVTQAQVVQQPVPINFNWDWELIIQPVPGPLPSEPIPLNLWGPTTINFGTPTPPFDLGTQENPLPVPPGYSGGTIPTEILSMNLIGSSSVLGNVVLRQSSTQQSLGEIQNLTDNGGNLTANSFFDIFFELEFDNPLVSGQRMTLFSDGDLQTPGLQAIRTGMDFTVADQIPRIDTLWIPTWIWSQFTANSAGLVDEFGVPWDTVIRIHGHQTVPEPSTVIAIGLALGLGVLSTKRKKI